MNSRAEGAVWQGRVDLGLTVQDALLNGVITLVLLASLVAVFFVVDKQHFQSDAVADFLSIVSGIRQANGGSASYTTAAFSQAAAENLLPSDDRYDSSNAGGDGAGGIEVPWSSTEITQTSTPTEQITIRVVFDDEGTCAAFMNFVAPGMLSVGGWGKSSAFTPSSDYIWRGVWQTNSVTSSPWTAQTACVDANGGMNFRFQ